MPTLTVQVSDEVAEALTRQARALLLGRRAYVRAVLSAVAQQATRDRECETASDAHQVGQSETLAARDAGGCTGFGPIATEADDAPDA